ncbi:MAG: hypothetical protein IJZ69_04280 [Bacteroidales bacterium]|nr:hypothetical protein [Bacteroidales bacterium]MBQ8809531.1 hypothetical protein [Bacteroidales bacterium]
MDNQTTDVQTNAQTDVQTDTQTNTQTSTDTQTDQSNIFGGTPAAPETYDFTDTCKGLGLELSQEASDEYVAICKECGVNNENANKLAAYGLKLQQEAANSVIEAQVAREKEWAEQFRQEVGKDYDATVQRIGIAKEWAERLHPGFTQMAVDTGAGNHPVFLHVMARVGDLVGEDNGRRLDNGTAGGSSTMYDKTDFSKYK